MASDQQNKLITYSSFWKEQILMVVEHALMQPPNSRKCFLDWNNIRHKCLFPCALLRVLQVSAVSMATGHAQIPGNVNIPSGLCNACTLCIKNHIQSFLLSTEFKGMSLVSGSELLS